MRGQLAESSLGGTAGLSDWHGAVADAGSLMSHPRAAEARDVLLEMVGHHPGAAEQGGIVNGVWREWWHHRWGALFSGEIGKGQWRSVWRVAFEGTMKKPWGCVAAW